MKLTSKQIDTSKVSITLIYVAEQEDLEQHWKIGIKN